MAELDFPEYHHVEGHILDLRSVFLDLHKLLLIFISSHEYSELCKLDGLEALDGLREWEWDEITRILISASICGRIELDREEGSVRDPETNVGFLWPDWSKPDASIVLTLRESFNKIIHARRIRADLEVDKEHEVTYYNNVVYFYGTHKGAEWRAELLIVDFVAQYFKTLRFA